MSYWTVLIIALMLVGPCAAFAKSAYEAAETSGIAGITTGGGFYAIGLAVSQTTAGSLEDLARSLMLGGMTVAGISAATWIVGGTFAAASKRELPRRSRSEVHVRPQDIGYNYRR